MQAASISEGYEVRAFDPRTLGVVKYGRVVSVGRSYARVDFGLTGAVRVPLGDIIEVTDTRAADIRADLAAGADIAEWHVRVVLNRMNAMLRTLAEIRGLPTTSERS